MEVFAAGARPFGDVTGSSHHTLHNGTITPSSPEEEDSSERTTNMIGLIAALCAGAIIIVGIAFVISKIRRRPQSSENDGATSQQSNNGNENAAFEVSITEKDEKSDTVSLPADIPQYDIKYIYTISGFPPEKPKRTPKRILGRIFGCNKKSEPPNIHEAIRRDLAQVYVY